ncbi:respiratory chain complex I subunit 1 family protein [Thermococcus sp. LS2]|uniref:respiratory chain complex I subunit 1 family protein n=1 Tax=Thermococcus sp. LS2 TaxID=1638260 RepID=UPI00143A6689|nr:NADH-quinone oxidoreductase subunit H [Thermococcus sp. LS2]NJE11523.1 hydrogenase [Thermococcus sp. LS2]
MEVQKIVFALITIAIIFFLPPLLDGISRKIKAILQWRQGGPILQTYYDLQSLLSMEPILPTERLAFRIAPYIAFASALSAALVLPFGNFVPVRFTGDFFVFLYVLAMFSVAMMIAGFSVNSTYTNAGANREMMLILSIEPVLGVAIGIFALNAHSLSISGIPLNLTFTPSTILAYVLLAYAVYAEGGFIPFDIAEAEPEILEGPLCEYSGKLLGIFKWSMLIKRLALLWLFVSFLVIPIIRDFIDISTFAGGLVVLVAQLVAVFVLYAIIAIIEASNARFRIDQAIRVNSKVFMASLVVLIIAALGW